MCGGEGVGLWTFHPGGYVPVRQISGEGGWRGTETFQMGNPCVRREHATSKTLAGDQSVCRAEMDGTGRKGERQGGHSKDTEHELG